MLAKGERSRASTCVCERVCVREREADRVCSDLRVGMITVLYVRTHAKEYSCGWYGLEDCAGSSMLGHSLYLDASIMPLI